MNQSTSEENRRNEIGDGDSPTAVSSESPSLMEAEMDSNLIKSTKKVLTKCWQGSEEDEEVRRRRRNLQNTTNNESESNNNGASYMSIPKNASQYKMDHTRRGKALIFNFDEWNLKKKTFLNKAKRYGSQKDKNDLSKCLKKLGFEVETYDNLDTENFAGKIHDARKADHSKADCILIAIMSHGEDDSFYVGDGGLLPVWTVVCEKFQPSQCPSLKNKPKIIFVQACRGDKLDEGTQVERADANRNPSMEQTDALAFSYKIPDAADNLVFWSCPYGYASYRDGNGSWFIQSICKVFNEHYENKKPMDLQKMLLEVTREVATEYESHNFKKQVPSTTSTLLREVHFHQKEMADDKCSNRTINKETGDVTVEDQQNGNLQTEV